MGSVSQPPYPFMYSTPEKLYLHGMHCESSKTPPSSSVTNIIVLPGVSFFVVGVTGLLPPEPLPLLEPPPLPPPPIGLEAAPPPLPVPDLDLGLLGGEF